MEDSIFYKFVKGEVEPNTKLYFDDDEFMAFDSIDPKSPIHILIIPKNPIESIADMAEGDTNMVGKMLYRAKLLAEELGFDNPGYRIAFNVRDGGGQRVPYLHLHLMAGKDFLE